MSNLEQTIKQLVEKMGFEDYSVSFDQDGGRFSVIINDKIFSKSLPNFVSDFNQMVRLIGRKNDFPFVVVDINNYRRQRHELILELARAAARKSVANKEEISLPPMNAFERRLIHVELAGRPDIKTESVGEDKDRFVIIKPL